MNAVFFVVFGVFILVMIGLAAAAVRWAIRRDRSARAARPDPAGGPADLSTDGGTSRR